MHIPRRARGGRRSGALAALRVAVALSAAACSRGVEEGKGRNPDPPPAPAASAAEPSPQEDRTLSQLAARSRSAAGLELESTFKVRREGGRIVKRLKVTVEGCRPGEVHPVQVDGFEVGKLGIGPKGKGEFTLEAGGEDSFPEGFAEPEAGSLVRIGELAALRLEAVERLTALEAAIAGPGALSGKITFRIERLGDSVSREFQVKVTNAAEKTVQPVSLEGVHVGDLNVDLGGKGKLLLSTREGRGFPADFPEPRAGSVVQVGELFRGAFRDDASRP